MALNSTLVLNRLGMEPCESARLPTPEPLNDTYTTSRLGLTFAGHDDPVRPRPVESPPPRIVLKRPEPLDSRLDVDVSIDKEPDPPPPSEPIAASEPSVPSGRKPLWPRFRRAASVLAIAIKNGILTRFIPTPKPVRQSEVSEVEIEVGAEEFKAHQITCPSPVYSESEQMVVYKKGTYKMPAELMSRLKHCAEASHQYQYRLVIESVEEFLTEHEFEHDEEPGDSPTQ